MRTICKSHIVGYSLNLSWAWFLTISYCICNARQFWHSLWRHLANFKIHSFPNYSLLHTMPVSISFYLWSDPSILIQTCEAYLINVLTNIITHLSSSLTFPHPISNLTIGFVVRLIDRNHPREKYEVCLVKCNLHTNSARSKPERDLNTN